MEKVKIIGECRNPKTVAWLLEQHGNFVTRPRNIIQQKIEEYLDGNNIKYVFKNPVWISSKNKAYFVDYYIPGYEVLIDIRPVLSSEFFNAVTEKPRRRAFKDLSGYRYQVIDFDDIKKGRYINKLQRCFSAIYRIYKI